MLKDAENRWGRRKVEVRLGSLCVHVLEDPLIASKVSVGAEKARPHSCTSTRGSGVGVGKIPDWHVWKRLEDCAMV